MSTKLLNVKEVSEALGISPRSVWRMWDAGVIPAPLRLGKSVRLSADVLEEFIRCGCPNVRKSCWQPTPVTGPCKCKGGVR